MTASLRDPRMGQGMDTRSWDVHAGPIYCLATGVLDGKTVITSGGADSTVRVWDLATCQPLGQPYTGHRGEVVAVTLADLDGRLVVVSAGEDGSVHVRNLATGQPVGAPFTCGERIGCLAVSAG
ncbi:WD40 repeat domain-containing protein [Solwaraspora sp. WMMB335]|uniref:WD40 repeat domain-containing protein n=1 Tax=Solwaraspora sp. WMMB335 TaxID=3404118 RepID=UPI003B934F6B